MKKTNIKQAIHKFLSISLVLLLLANIGIITNNNNISQAVTKAKLNKTSINVKEGKKVKLKLTNKTSSMKVKWNSKNKKIATVNKNGQITGVKKGNTTVTAKVTLGDSNYTLKCKVKVTKKVNNQVADKEEQAEPVEEKPIVISDYLKDVFSSYFSVGNAVTPQQLGNDDTLTHIKNHYNSITMENDMKPFYILGYSPRLVDIKDAEFPVPDSYKDSKIPALNFSTVDKVLEIAQKAGLKMRGHTLVWHSQTPMWFFYEDFDMSKKLVSKEVMNGRMEYYIQQVLLHVQNKAPEVIYAWDVVNEIFEDNGSLRKAGFNMGAGESLWMSIYKSDEFAVKAFEYADKYREDGVKLFYNDYNEYIQGKRDAMYSFAQKLYAKGHIDGIGMQSHLDISFPSVKLIGDAIDKFVSVAPDFEVQLTELDVTLNFHGNSGHTIEDQAIYYGDLFKMILDKKKSGANITNITFWGLYDEASWRRANEPLLFTYGFEPKPAYISVINAAK